MSEKELQELIDTISETWIQHGGDRHDFNDSIDEIKDRIEHYEEEYGVND